MNELGDGLKAYSHLAHEADWKRASDQHVGGMPASMQSVGDMLPDAFKRPEDTIADATSSTGLQFDVAILTFTRRRQAMGFGPERMERDIATVTETCNRLRELCESPIEHQMVPWLVCQHYGEFASGAPVAHIPKLDAEVPAADLLIVPQFAFARFRVDFAIVAKVGIQTRIVAVECDGEAFHRDVRRDDRRDRYLAGWNIPTVRATGTEITLNPARVAESVARHVIDWAVPLGVDP